MLLLLQLMTLNVFLPVHLKYHEAFNTHYFFVALLKLYLVYTSTFSFMQDIIIHMTTMLPMLLYSKTLISNVWLEVCCSRLSFLYFSFFNNLLLNNQPEIVYFILIWANFGIHLFIGFIASSFSLFLKVHSFCVH